MPYQNEFANKSSHSDIIKNPDVVGFLGDCDYLKEPSHEEGEAMGARFVDPPSIEDATFPASIIAVDGSPYEAQISDRLPNTRLGYVKVGSVLIDLSQYNSLRTHNSMVDPFRVAKLKNNNDSLTFTLPGSNINWRGYGSVRDGFRAALDAQLADEKTRFNPQDPKTSLRTTLFHLASRREKLGTGVSTKLKIHKCPNPDCDSRQGDDTNEEDKSSEKAIPIEVEDVLDAQYCPCCGEEVYPSDCLRLWEQISEHQSNQRVLNLLMSVIEHLMPIHYIRYLAERSLPSLTEMAFFIDNPLAIFDVTAWLIQPIMHYLHEINQCLIQADYRPILLIGLQKSGQIVDHVHLINRYIPPERILAIDDDYRYKYILAGRNPSDKGFGSQTYYGQDFIYKTASKRYFVFALPYPMASKTRDDFTTIKTDYSLYSELPRALALINHFETDLYKNAVVPIALAHRYTSISLVPGGRVLDVLSRRALQEKK